ncbi:piggyBac transposable element-derived protein 3-like [Parasteatoda tepidariorum]|uniref:piggyBac transposable element-derived protein 3-like n=1 Tax=Parasteatoda tepidariorum TaxID=114398 RepID=UPI0039BC5D44
MYWSLDEDKGLPIIWKCMSRNRFKSLKQNINLSDNFCLDKTDKFAKPRPFLKHLNQKYLQFGIFSQHLSIDKEMVSYFGRHSSKMFIKGKPVRFGFKLWCLCSSDEYLFQFIPYGGAEAKSDEQNMPLRTRVVTKLLSVVSNPVMHKIYFDNFFSSYGLFEILKIELWFFEIFFASGTARENRIAGCILDDSKNMKKKHRGSYDFAFNKDAETCAIKWNDNAVVSIVTNNCKMLPLVNAKRYSRKKRKEVVITQPNVISDYNGVDQWFQTWGR